jgi:hypothetical protein
MAAEDFFTRWSKKKTEATTTVDAAVSATDISERPLSEQAVNEKNNVPSDAAVKSLPTQEDVDKLTHDSDYSAFMSQGVDESVKRSAMKKLFTDPHFNIMDGLDIYIDDYNKFEPITPELLASLNHAKALLDPLSQLKTPLMRLLEKIPETKELAVDGEALAIEDQANVADGGDSVGCDAEQKKDHAEQQVSQATLWGHAKEDELPAENLKAKPDADNV